MTIHGFIYEWIDSANGLKYIGKHEGTPDDGYIGSGVVFKKFYNKYPERFTRQILWESHSTTSSELKTMEEEYLNQISDDELFYGKNQKYYNQVRNSSGYTSENNPMNHQECIDRMMQTQRDNGTRSDPHTNAVKKYGIEKVREMKSKAAIGNKNAAGKHNKNGKKPKPRTKEQKDNIRKSINDMYSRKKNDGSYIKSSGRPRDPKYSNIIALVEEHGLQKTAEILKISKESVRSRFYGYRKVKKL